jgi:membrane-associated phospholipid phosphatase
MPRTFCLAPRMCAVAALAAGAASATHADGHARLGDVLSFALPAGVAAHELWRDDTEGLLQFSESLVVTLVGTELLKRTTHVERPDRSNDQAFPSGHASRSFAAAAYMHRRHGFEAAWPWYLGATYVGWTRVHADRHRWGDIAGSAALSVASAWWLVTPARERGLSVLPMLAPGRVAVEIQASW